MSDFKNWVSANGGHLYKVHRIYSNVHFCLFIYLYKKLNMDSHSGKVFKVERYIPYNILVHYCTIHTNLEVTIRQM